MKANKHAIKPSMAIISVVLCLLFLLGSFPALAAEREPSEELSSEQTAKPEALPEAIPSDEPSEDLMEGPLSLWSEDSMARAELISYMEAVTDESGADYIPVDHRVAVFDLDGTLFCETDPNYFDYCLLKYRVLDDPDYKDAASDFEREVALKIQEQNETGASFEGLEVDHGKAVASAFAGMTPEEFNAYIQEFKKQPMPSYEGMNRGNGWYLPMLQVVDYLKENDFTVYIVSGTDRFIVRGIVDDSPLDLPPWQIIGSDETLVAADQGETDGLSYVYDEDDALVLGGEFIVKNLKMNKVTVIAQEIGVQPVLSFGNSTGDSSMAAYVTGGNPYRSLAFMLCCDDTERENGSIEKADKMFDLCGTYGWVPVSMKNDWTTIYGDDVTYLGVPHPTELEVTGQGRIAAVESPDEAAGVQVETVEADSFSMDYVRFGHGEKTLVILPGLSVQSVMGSADAIAEAYDLFTEDYTVYLFDRRKDLPDAYSVYDMARDTAEAIRALGLEPVSLMGVSQGGMIAMDITIRNPGLVEKLVLGSTSACVTEEQYETMGAWVRLAEDGNAEGLYLAFGEALYPVEMFDESAELLVEAAKTVTAEELERFIVLAEGTRGFDVYDELEKISCPVLLIGSLDDGVLGADATTQIAERLDSLSNFELYMYDGYGHAAYDTAPDYKERVLDFLRPGAEE